MQTQHEPVPYVAFTIRKNEHGRYCVAGWHNRGVAQWACEPETLHLWNKSVHFGNAIAETNDIEGARAVLPVKAIRLECSPNVPVPLELYVTP
jgi:hypothetical protein